MEFSEYPLHDSPRGWFARELYFQMKRNPDIYLIAVDLGYGMLDRIKEDFPDQYFNPNAAEQCAMGAAIGATLSGKTVFVYSITSFLLYRPFEWIRNYLNHEEIPVRLVGSGLDADYEHDGITHQTHDAKKVLDLFPNIVQLYPTTKELVPDFVQVMIERDQPAFLCLRR